MTTKDNQTDSSATSGELTSAHAKIYRDAIALVCEGWTLPSDARKVLETALWAHPAPQAATTEQAGDDPCKVCNGTRRVYTGPIGDPPEECEACFDQEPAATTASTRPFYKAKMRTHSCGLPGEYDTRIMTCTGCADADAQATTASAADQQAALNVSSKGTVCKSDEACKTPAGCYLSGCLVKATTASASGEPIYQTMEGEFGEYWADTDKAGFDAAIAEGIETRIVYRAPAPSREAAPLTDWIAEAIRLFGSLRVALHWPDLESHLKKMEESGRKHQASLAMEPMQPSREATVPQIKTWQERRRWDRVQMADGGSKAQLPVKPYMEAEIADLRAALAGREAAVPLDERARKEHENAEFTEWWVSSGQQASHDLTTENAAHATWQERARRAALAQRSAPQPAATDAEVGDEVLPKLHDFREDEEFGEMLAAAVKAFTDCPQSIAAINDAMRRLNASIRERTREYGVACVAADRARRAGSTGGDVCAWTVHEEEGYWRTACGREWVLIDGTPADNRMDFCHGCGKPLAATPSPQSPAGEEQ